MVSGTIPLLRRIHWLVFGTVLAVAALSLLFTTFMIYDDEGYVLFSLKNFTEHGGLYEQVYSQYGPFFYLFNQVLHLGGLGVDFTNSSARLLTAFYWLATIGLCGAIVWRITRSNIATTSAAAGVFLHLWPMTSEPSHPGGLIVFLVAIATWCGVVWPRAPRRLAPALGAIVAALCLIKINVGVFLLAGAGAWWLLHLDEPWLGSRRRVWVVAAAFALLPVALMRKQLDLDWVVVFAVVTAAAGVATVFAAGPGVSPLTRPKDLAWAIAAGALVVVVTTVAIVAQGTSLPGLLEGVLLGPLRHPQNYLAEVKWRTGALPFAVGSLAVAGLVLVRRSPLVIGAVATARVIALVGYLVSWLVTDLIHPHALIMSYGLALTWLFVLPLGDDTETQPARSWLGLLLLPQALHAFPVAGSQISWGTFLWVPLAVIGTCDAVRWWAARSAAAGRILAGASVLMLGGLSWRCLLSAQIGLARVRESSPLELPGANGLLLPDGLETTLRVLARNAVMHADVLFSDPGMDSFYLWTEVPPPTLANATHWFTLLSPVQQEAIREKLAASPRSCVIVQRDVLEFLRRQHIAIESPLARWLEENYEIAFTLETYEFWVRRGRTIAPINTASARESAGGTSPRYQLSLTLAESLRDVSSVELCNLDYDRNLSAMTWTAADAQVFVTPLNSAGHEAGPERPLTFPFTIRGLVRLNVRTDRLPANFRFGHGVLYLRDAAGRRVAEARFVN